MTFKMVLNPLTNRHIRQGSVLHMKLIKKGVMSPEGEDLTKQPEEEKEQVERVIEKRKVIKYRIKKM